jgi:hypothetical protein
MPQDAFCVGIRYHACRNPAAIAGALSWVRANKGVAEYGAKEAIQVWNTRATELTVSTGSGTCWRVCPEMAKELRAVLYLVGISAHEI